MINMGQVSDVYILIYLCITVCFFILKTKSYRVFDVDLIALP